MKNPLQLAALMVLLSTAFAAAASAPVALNDQIIFGQPASEQAHQVQAPQSDVVRGLLDEPARRLLPGTPQTWEGGRCAFVMQVDPAVQNYLTARFSGDDVNQNYLILFCEGKQVGYRHLGDIDVLALPDEEPRYNGRFYYVTTPLPLSMTRGKREVHLEIRATGAIWGYGGTFEQYQKTMVHPSRGIYRVYTHTDGSFVPPVDEVQGHAPQATPRTEPGPEVLRQASVRVNKSLDDCLKSTKPLNQMQVQFLAKAYTVPGTPAFHSAVAVERIVTSIDDLYRRWRSDPEALWQDKATWNPGWFGVGPAGDAVRRLHEQLEPALNQNLDGNTSRRTGWSAMFQASRDWLRDNRRWLTNQAMFTDTNLYLCNRAVAAIDPSHALPEDRALDYLYQSVGLVPWLGRDTPQGPEKLFGSAFYQVTSKGLTRERGYVGSYGEGGVEGAIDIYNATRESDGAGDPKIKAQLIKMLRARGPFRYPMLDEENHPAMRLETTVGWRDTHEPGDVTYAQRVGNDHSALEAAVMTMDPVVIGYVQQMFADNQFFAAVAHHLKDTRLRGTIGLLDESAQYQLMSAQPATGHKLPMSWDQPDFVFSDEEDGVVAIKHGDEILYASLYWRAGYGVNSLARAHYLTPDYQQVAVVHEQAITPNIGHAYKRPDWINFGFGDGGTHIRYPADVHQAYAGEELPIAPIPADVKTKPGEESHFAGRADFYTLRFGQYLIAMNTTADRSFDLPEPDGSAEADDLVAGKRVKLSKSMPIGPKSTAVFYIAHQERRTK